MIVLAAGKETQCQGKPYLNDLHVALHSNPNVQIANVLVVLDRKFIKIRVRPAALTNVFQCFCYAMLDRRLQPIAH